MTKLKYCLMRRKEVARYVKSLGPLERVETAGGIEIKLSEAAMKAVKKRAVKANKRGFATIHNLETGLLGQAAVAYELKRNWLEGVMQMTQEADIYDILYRSCAMDVKTFDIRPYFVEPHSLMAVRLRQFHNLLRHYLFYIGVLQIGVDKVRIMGFVTRKYLESLEAEDSTVIYEDGDPDKKNVVVKKLAQFTEISHLDAVIDRMLVSASQFASSFKR